MITAIIVDDEEKSRITLKNLITEHCPTVSIKALCGSVDAAVDEIEKHHPRLVFLDVEMPFNNGFNLLERMPHAGFDVVFTTAHDHYAIKAIKYSALDYMLKPIDAEELKAAVDRVDSSPKNPKDRLGQFEALLSNIKSKAVKIAVPTFEGLQMINTDDIIKCAADESYTRMILTNRQKITVSKMLKEYEKLLEEFNFFRVHNSCLINLKHVSRYIKGDGGYVIMSDGDSVEVSRRKKNELLSRLALIQY